MCWTESWNGADCTPDDVVADIVNQRKGPMPKTSEMKESKFLKKEDIGRGVLVTITDVVQKNVAMEGAAPDLKWCLVVSELDKPLVLNATNIQLIERVTGSDDTDHWIGQQVVLYTDPNVSYGGKIVGGIRVRGRKSGAGPVTRAVPPPPPPPMPTADDIVDDDDMPF